MAHDGCQGCRHANKQINEPPCVNCKQSAPFGSAEGMSKPDLYETHDSVNHPAHYEQGIECIEEMLMVFGVEAVIHFCLLNVWKYRKRALQKNGQEDMDKADWYMKKFVELTKGEEE